MSSCLKRCHAALVLLFALAAPALAHEADAGVEPSTVVTGVRPGRSASEVVVDQRVLQAAPRTSAVDVLRVVPGLVASQHSGEGKAQQLFLRGFDAVHGQDVELNVAGLPVNDVSHIHALGYADLTWLIPEAVREVRVTEGSYRAAQGDFAVAGSVRYELGLAERGVTAAATMASFGRYRLFAGVRPFDAPETFAAVEYTQGDGFGPHRAFGRVSLLGQGVVQLGDVQVRAVVGSAAAHFDSPGTAREDAGRGFFDAFGEGQGGTTSRHQLLLSAERPGADGKTVFEAFGVLNDLRLRNNFTGFTRDPRGDGLEQTHRDGLLGVRALHHRHLDLGGSRFRLELGLAGRRDGITQTQRGYRERDGLAIRDDIDARLTQTMVSGWTEVAWLPQKWRVMLGGRVDVLALDVFDALALDAPRLEARPGATRAAMGAHAALKAAVERELSDAWRLFVNYGDGFRSPQARSVANGERAPFVTVRGAEVGAAFASPSLSVQAAAFGSWVADDVFFDHAEGRTAPLGSTLRGGGTVSVLATPVAGWLVSASGTAANARLVPSGALLPYFAPLVGRLDTSYTREVTVLGWPAQLLAGLGATAIGPRPLPFGDFSRAVGLLDVRLSARVKAVALRLDVQNVFDARWRDGEFTFVSTWDAATSSQLPARHFTAGAPRTAFVTLEIHL